MLHRGYFDCNIRRPILQEAQKAYDQGQYSMGQQAPVAPAASMLAPNVGGAPIVNSSGESKDIDAAISDARGKRKADYDGSSEAGDTKKPRLGGLSWQIRLAKVF